MTDSSEEGALPSVSIQGRDDSLRCVDCTSSRLCHFHQARYDAAIGREPVVHQMAHALAVVDDAIHPFLMHHANGTEPSDGEKAYLRRAAFIAADARQRWARATEVAR